MEDREQDIEYLPLDRVLTDPRNPKEHELDAIEESIVRFGFTAPLLNDERTGQIVAGHGRLEALKHLRDNPEHLAQLRTKHGDTRTGPPAGILIDHNGDWTVPVTRGWSSRNDQEAAAYLITDNRLTENGGWDHRALSTLLDEIGDPDLIDLTGWDLDELAGILDDAEETMPEEGDADLKPIDVVWGVAVTCRSEQQQTELLERLTAEGYDVRALM